MPRVTSQKNRQALLVVGEALDTNYEPERLALYDAQGNPINFSSASSIPPGGTTGQLLGKTADDDYNVGWVDSSGGGGGGTVDVETAYANAIMRDEPIAYWPLSIEADASDNSGNGHDLTPYGGIEPGLGIPGPFGGSSTYFDGDDDRLVATDAPVLSLLTKPTPNVLTLEMWMNPTDTPPVGASQISGAGWTNWAVDGSGSGSTGIVLGVLNLISSTNPGWSFATLFESVDFNEWSDKVQGYVHANRWNHLAVLLGPSQVQYNNGFYRPFGSGAATSGIVQFFIGGYGVAPNKRFFNGHIAHVALYDYPLSLRRLTEHAALAQFDF